MRVEPIRVRRAQANEDEMTISDLISTHGIENVSCAIIRDIGGDRHTGSRSSWAPAATYNLEPSDIAVDVVRELPGMVFIASDNSVWMVSK
jgi:hypothetical protein